MDAVSSAQSDLMMPAETIRLLMGIPHPDAKGGPPTHLPLLVEYFREHPDYEIRTFFYGSKFFGTERGQSETKLRKLVVTSGKLFEYLYLLATFRPNVVHINTAFTKLAILRDFPFAVVSRIFRQKSIFKLHGSHLDLLRTESSLQLFTIKIFLWGATRIGVLSKPEMQQHTQRFGYVEKFVLTKNIVAPPKPAMPIDVAERHTDETCGLFVSRIDPLKGLQDLINAMPDICAAVPHFRLIVAGDGPDRENCVDLANRLGVGKAITWLGYIDNQSLQSLYSQCDIFVFPTHYPEGMPMVLVEALRSGISIVTTPVWFSRSYLTDGRNCRFVEAGNPGDLTAKIVDVLRDKELQSTMRRENPRLVGEFGSTTVGREFEAIYKGMLA